MVEAPSTEERCGIEGFPEQGLRRALYASRITESLAPRKQTATEVGLQRKARIPGHFSDARPTPALYDKAYDMASRGFAEIEPVLRRACSGQSHDAMHGGEDEEVIIPPLLLRVRVAKSVRDYEAMRDADSPPPEALVNGVRSLRSLGQMKEEVHRLKKKQQKEESDAAARIQARYRGRQANKQVQEMREQKQAIQSRYRHRVAERRQKEQEAASATKIQARFRQKQAASEVEGMRQQKHAQACSNREQSRRQRLDEFRQWISVKVDVVLEANGRAVVNVQLAPKDGLPGTSDTEIDIPMNDETAQAATKIQAKF
ncbi:unnamed protein product, partial [Symbiodinium sp. CCMP2456]